MRADPSLITGAQLAKYRVDALTLLAPELIHSTKGVGGIGF